MGFNSGLKGLNTLTKQNLDQKITVFDEVANQA
jgi:hypothetical protein